MKFKMTDPTWWIFSNYDCHGNTITVLFILFYIITILYLNNHGQAFFLVYIHIVLISLQENIKHRMSKAGNRQTLLWREGQLLDDFRMTFAGWFIFT